MSTYVRYSIPTRHTTDIVPRPHRFNVFVSRIGLAKLLIRELIRYRGNLAVITSRPCIYGVFSGLFGGFAPRSQQCVGCLRCIVQYPDVVKVEPNQDRRQLGDSYFDPDKVDTVLYEAATGRVPVRGAGYRGTFGGDGWDGMWTDMSEIVRPTRDGIHGREFISTSVDLGEKASFLTFDGGGQISGPSPKVVSPPIPFLFDRPPRSLESASLFTALTNAASAVHTLAFVPIAWQVELGLKGEHIVPVIAPSEVNLLDQLSCQPVIIELDGWDEVAYQALGQRYPQSMVCLRTPYGDELATYIQAGVSLFHLTANYHGRNRDHFVLGAIRSAHDDLVSNGVREQVTLIGSGGIVAAEHVAKAIISGLDAVVLDTPLMVALQARFVGECLDQTSSNLELPTFEVEWAEQRIMNLVASWRDQLLEVLGAMGLREARRLRGEIGRAMFQVDLEQETFSGIKGYED